MSMSMSMTSCRFLTITQICADANHASAHLNTYVNIQQESNCDDFHRLLFHLISTIDNACVPLSKML